MTVIFHYRAGHTKPMAERFAKLLQRMGHGYYRTDEPEPIRLPDPVVIPEPVFVREEISEQASELPVVFKARRGRKPKFKPHAQPETQPETKTDND